MPANTVMYIDEKLIKISMKELAGAKRLTNALLMVVPIIGRVTLIGKRGGLNNYALTLPRQGFVAGLNRGDKVQIMVTIPTPTGIHYFNGVLEGTVAHVTKNVVRVYLYARYRPVVEQAFLQKWPVLVYSIFVTRSGSGEA